MNKFEVRNMDLYYGSFHALKNINIDIPEKEITAFIGPLFIARLYCINEFVIPPSKSNPPPSNPSGEVLLSCEKQY